MTSGIAFLAINFWNISGQCTAKKDAIDGTDEMKRFSKAKKKGSSEKKGNGDDCTEL